MSYDDNFGLMQQQAKEVANSLTGRYIPPTDRQKLIEKQSILQQELERVETALEMLNAHPDLEEFTKVLQAALR